MNVLICSPASYFADDVATSCGGCDAPVFHRPHVPREAVPLCIACGGAWLAAEAAGGTPAVLQLTPETVREVELFRAAPKGGIS